MHNDDAFQGQIRDGDTITLKIKAAVAGDPSEGWVIDTVTARHNDRIHRILPDDAFDLGLRFLTSFIFDAPDRDRAIGQMVAACEGLARGSRRSSPT